MNITSTVPASSTSSQKTSETNNPSTSLGKNDFLKLLMAQLGHQDPLNPMDDQAFVAQLAQFANVEQLQNANTSLTSLLTAQNSMNQFNAAGLVGKQALYQTNAVVVSSAGVSRANAQIASDAADVTVVVSDAQGQAIRAVDLGPQSTGTVGFTWDGRDASGVPVAAGTYNVSYNAVDSSGQTVPVSMRSQGTITGVSFANGATNLMVNGSQIKLSDVLEVSQGA